MKSNYSDTMNIFGDSAETVGKGSPITLAVCNKRITTELSEDVTIPDYLPEIRKLIRVGVTPSAPSKYVSGSSVQFSGGVGYSVCYIGADGKLYGAEFSGEYNLNAPFDGVEYDMNGGVTASADITVESVVGKVNSARKISLRSHLNAAVLALASCRSDDTAIGADQLHESTRRLVKEMGYCRQMQGCNDEIELHDTLDLSAEKAEFITADCGVFLEEVRAGDGYIDCRGTVKLKYLLRKAGESAPYSVERRIPLSEIVEMDGIAPGMACTAYCTRCGIDTRADDGEEGGIECTLRMRLVAQGFSDEKMSYVSDAYSTVYGCECEKVAVKLPVMSCCGIRNMTFDATAAADKLIKAENGAMKIADVSVSAVASGIERSADTGKAAVVGNVTFNVICSAARPEGDDELFVTENEFPFKVETCELTGDTDLGSCYACAVDPTVRVNGEELEFTCEIGVSCWGVAFETVEKVASVELGDRLEDEGRGISICYPDKSDSLWSVAKKYRADAETVALENGIPSDISADDPRTLESVRYLIV